LHQVQRGSGAHGEGLRLKSKLGGIALVAALVGCVNGEDPSDAATQGSLGGPCFANNTCNSNLVCVLVNGKGVCQEGDASVQDVANDTTTSEGGSDATQDVAADVDAGCDAGVTPSAVCAGSCGLCCPINGQCITSGCGQSCNNTPCWSCSKRLDCGGGQYYCCASNSTLQPTCPPTASVDGNTSVYCSTAPCTNGFFLCVTSADCPTTAPTCVPAKASGLFVTTIGVCQ
jgi:hypothetical protein